MPPDNDVGWYFSAKRLFLDFAGERVVFGSPDPIKTGLPGIRRLKSKFCAKTVPQRLFAKNIDIPENSEPLLSDHIMDLCVTFGE